MPVFKLDIDIVLMGLRGIREAAGELLDSCSAISLHKGKITIRILCIGRLFFAVLVLVPRHSIFWWWWRMNRMQGYSGYFGSSVISSLKELGVGAGAGGGTHKGRWSRWNL
jgi:hypothetical protein